LRLTFTAKEGLTDNIKIYVKWKYFL